MLSIDWASDFGCEIESMGVRWASSLSIRVRPPCSRTLQLAALEEELNQERDCLTRAKRERDALRMEVTSLRQSQGFANRYYRS